jgi:hypothetical protein
MSQTLFSARVMRSCVRLSYCMGLLLFAGSTAALGEVCKAVPAHVLSDAEVVFNEGDHAKAETMLKDELVKTPNDPDKSALLIRALLWPRKTSEAADVLNKALAAHPDSAALLTEKAEVLFRQARPWDVGTALGAALKVDPCYPRADILYAWLASAESNHATYRKAVLTAHQIDPNDAEIRSYWLNILPLKERLATLEDLMASGAIADVEELKRMQKRVDALHRRETEPSMPCQLTSDSKSSEVPLQEFIREVHGNLAPVGHALSVEINGHASLLSMNTLASGLSVTRPVAEHAGLKPVGIEPNQTPQHGYRAYAERIRIGGMEFKDCMVRVMDRGGDQDGMIGTDVFSQFLITIDYPMRKLRFDPLPIAPATENPTPSLATAGGGDSDSQTGSGGDASSEWPALTDRYVAPEMKDWIRIYRVSQRLIVPASLHPPDLKLFLVDTGVGPTIVSPEAAREVTKVDVNADMRVTARNGTVSNGYVAEALDLKFGGFSKHLLGVPAMDMDTQSMYSAMQISGILGSDILEELTVHIDYRDGLMKFEYDPKRGYHPQNH